MQAIQQPATFRRKHRSIARCSKGKKDKTQTAATGSGSDAFLTQSFGPVTDLGRPSSKLAKNAGQYFYQSLRHLAALYQFNPFIITDGKYPENILASFTHAKEMMKQKAGEVELVITQDKEGYPFLSTALELSTGWTLYYVPVDPLVKLHRQRNRPAFTLLLSVYAYLYQVAGMPLCRDYSPTYSCYDMMQENLQDNEAGYEPEEYQGYLRDFSALNRFLPVLNKHIVKQVHLDEFENRVQSFQAVDEMEEKLLEAANRMLSVYRSWPDKSFMENCNSEFLYPDEEERGYVEQYFSFCWTTEGWMIEHLCECINCELQERSVMDQPTALQAFNQAQHVPYHDLSFEKELLDTISQLIDAINLIV